MEKVKIKSCVKSETAKGITYYKIEVEDGRIGMTYDDLTSEIGNEIELDVKEGKLYNNILQYYFNKPKGKGFFKKDYTFEKRNSSLEKAIETAKISEKTLTSKEIKPQESQEQNLDKKVEFN